MYIHVYYVGTQDRKRGRTEDRCDYCSSNARQRARFEILKVKVYTATGELERERLSMYIRGSRLCRSGA